MREKNELKAKMWDIVKLWFPCESYGYTETVEATCKLLREEIEKVENPYLDEPNGYVFEDCRQAILAIFKEV